MSLKNKILQYACNLVLRNNVDVYCACSKIAGESKFIDSVVKDKLIIIKNGIDVEKFKFNVRKRVELRGLLNIQDDEFVVGHVGRFSDEKNHTFLIDIFNEIVKLRPLSRLMLIGSGELESTVKDKVKLLDLEEKVLFIGNVNNVYDYYQAMDCFVLPSKFEGLPLVGIEAQSVGLLCFFADTITSELGVTSLARYISLNEIPKVWAEKICENNKEDRLDMTEAIKNAGFDIETEIKKIESFYRGKVSDDV